VVTPNGEALPEIRAHDGTLASVGEPALDEVVVCRLSSRSTRDADWRCVYWQVTSFEPAVN
jgi:hypothetical protein